jgi:hypothetical protein
LSGANLFDVSFAYDETGLKKFMRDTVQEDERGHH